MPDDADNVTPEDIINQGPIFGEEYTRQKYNDPKNDVPTNNLKRLDRVLEQIKPIDLFGDNFTMRLSGEDAKIFLQGDEFKYDFAFILFCLDKRHPLNGELSQKSAEIFFIAKKLFSDNETFKNWKNDINKRKQKVRNVAYGGSTPFTCEREKWPVTDKNGLPLSQSANAIAALRWYLEDEGITVKYDHWRNGISINNPKKSKFPREGKEFILKNWINRICDKFHVLFTIEHMKYASGQLAAFHEFHSLLGYLDDLKWDGKDRLPILVKDIMKLEGTELQLSVITKQLIASVRRVRFPGISLWFLAFINAVGGQSQMGAGSMLMGQ